VKRRRVFQDPGWKDHEKIRLKTFPIDRPGARQLRFDGNPLNIENQFVADVCPKIFGDIRIQRDGNGITGMIIDASHPLAGADLFRVGKLVAVSRSIFALQFPLRCLSVRIQKDLSRPPAFYLSQPHRHDRRLLDHRQARGAHDVGYALLLIRLDIKEKYIRLIIRSD
jgi:hypothetical protein